MSGRDPDSGPISAADRLTDRERRIIEFTSADFADTLEPIHEGVIDNVVLGDVSLSDPAAVRTAIQREYNERSEDFDDSVYRMHNEGASAGRAAAVDRYALDLPIDMFNAAANERLLNNSLTMSEATRSRMVGDLQDTLAAGFREGLGGDRLERRLRDNVFRDMRGYESLRVARTNVISASNFGAYQSYRESSANAKRWISVLGRNTRSTHRSAHNQTVAIDAKFTVGGSQADYPGDPALPASEVANCLCTSAPVFNADL